MLPPLISLRKVDRTCIPCCGQPDRKQPFAPEEIPPTFERIARYFSFVHIFEQPNGNGSTKWGNKTMLFEGGIITVAVALILMALLLFRAIFRKIYSRLATRAVIKREINRIA